MGTSYTVQQGDTLVSIAHQHGFRAWETIWQDPGNAELRKKRPNPMVLAPGDTVNIPDKRVKEFVCATNQLHTFRLRPLHARLHLVMKDDNGAPYAHRRYELTVDGKRYSGTTDGEGTLEELLAPDAKKGELSLFTGSGAPRKWPIELGHVDPVDLTSGVKARLQNLGYDCGEVNDTLDDAAKAALRDFQADHGLDASGEIDEPTRKALERAYAGA